MTAEMGSPLLPPSSPAYGTTGENEKKSLPDTNYLGGVFVYFAGTTSSLQNVEMVNSRALEWRTVVWPFQHPNLYMQ